MGEDSLDGLLLHVDKFVNIQMFKDEANTQAPGSDFTGTSQAVLRLTGVHGNLESTKSSESAENLESTEKMTLRLVSFHKISSLETKSDLN